MAFDDAVRFSHSESKSSPRWKVLNLRGFFAGLPTNEKGSLPKAEIVAVLRDEGERWCDWVETLPEARAVEIRSARRGDPGAKTASRC